MAIGFNDIFISYGRGNINSPGSKDLSLKLHKILEEKGFDVWLDHQDIPHAVDFQKEINEGIKNADSFIFIISPHAVASLYCMREIELAVELNKRIIPILHVLPDSELLEDALHPEIKKLNWVYFSEEADFDNALSQLEAALLTDQDYIANHTSYTSKAVNWRENTRSTDHLLRGVALRDAERWFEEAKANTKNPAPSKLQEEYIKKSRKNSNFRLLRRVAALIVFLLISTALTLALYYSKMEQVAAKQALENIKRANSNRLLARVSEIQCDDSDSVALQVAALAYEADTNNLMAKAVLFDAYYQTFNADSKEKVISAWDTETKKDKNGNYAILEDEHTVTIYNESGERYASCKSAKNLTDIYYEVDEETIYAKTDEGEVLAYHLATGWLLKNIKKNKVPEL
ncbi:MAG: toll/interleukin-1 receptor domain-containing protein, partial [Bacteroidota bacterium]